MFICEICGQSYALLKTLQRHIRDCHVTTQSRTCQHCDKIFKTAQTMRTHAKNCPRNPINVREKIMCGRCGRLILVTFIESHGKRCHGGVLECPHCDKTSTTRYLLKRHISMRHHVSVLGFFHTNHNLFGDYSRFLPRQSTFSWLMMLSIIR